MEKEFVPYEEALVLKELGFDEPCMSSRDMNNGEGLIQLPLYQQAFRWFREKYNLFGCVELLSSDIHTNAPKWFIRIDDIVTNDYVYHSLDDSMQFNTYEEAELACLVKLIEIVKEKTK